ncbi:MAG: hypothetical protein LM590_14960 [Thermofilum sp.]|jgi:hypothetical protein|nr:hypothetical protein [Thermofilum sp.]
MHILKTLVIIAIVAAALTAVLIAFYTKRQEQVEHKEPEYNVQWPPNRVFPSFAQPRELYVVDLRGGGLFHGLPPLGTSDSTGAGEQRAT